MPLQFSDSVFVVTSFLWWWNSSFRRHLFYELRRHSWVEMWNDRVSGSLQSKSDGWGVHVWRPMFIPSLILSVQVIHIAINNRWWGFSGAVFEFVVEIYSWFDADSDFAGIQKPVSDPTRVTMCVRHSQYTPVCLVSRKQCDNQYERFLRASAQSAVCSSGRRVVFECMGCGTPGPRGPGTHKVFRRNFTMGGHPQSFGRKSKRKWKF